MKYELILDGFNGSSDETDDHIIWVSSPLSFKDMQQRILHLIGKQCTSVVTLPNDVPVDFKLPRDEAKLIAKVKEVTHE